MRFRTSSNMRAGVVMLVVGLIIIGLGIRDIEAVKYVVGLLMSFVGIWGMTRF